MQRSLWSRTAAMPGGLQGALWASGSMLPFLVRLLGSGKQSNHESMPRWEKAEVAAGPACCGEPLPAHVAGHTASAWGWPRAEEGGALSCMQPGPAEAGCWQCGRDGDVLQTWLAARLLLDDWIRLCPWQHCSSSVASLSAPGQACVLPMQRRPTSAAVAQLSRASSGGVSHLSRANSGEPCIALGRQLSTPA